MTELNNDLKKTELYDEHLKLGGRMVPFAGFSMPVQYSSLKEEILAVRNKVGVFDVSHMGEFFVEGPDAVKFIDYAVTNDIHSAPIHKAIYALLCHETGGIIDDLIVYKLAAEKLLICVNAANIEKDWQHLQKLFSQGRWNCRLRNASDDYSLLAVQGPQTEVVLRELGIIPDHLTEADLVYYSARELSLNNHSSNNNGQNYILARTGYTGEDGFEIFASHQLIKNLWQQLINKGVMPCGLGARDVLRLEVCYPLYGNELSDDITPFDCGLKWAVKMQKENFHGKKSLENYQPRYKLLKLSLEKLIPRKDHEVQNEQGQKVGIITSGTMSPLVNKGIALALIEINKFSNQEKLYINIRDKNYLAELHTRPFVMGGHK